MGMASSTLINKVFGAAEYYKAWRWGVDIAFTAFGLLFLLSLPLILVPKQILGIFLTGDSRLVDSAVIPLQLTAISIMADSVAQVLTQSLLGTGSKKSDLFNLNRIRSG